MRRFRQRSRARSNRATGNGGDGPERRRGREENATDSQKLPEKCGERRASPRRPLFFGDFPGKPLRETVSGPEIRR